MPSGITASNSVAPAASSTSSIYSTAPNTIAPSLSGTTIRESIMDWSITPSDLQPELTKANPISIPTIEALNAHHKEYTSASHVHYRSVTKRSRVRRVIMAMLSCSCCGSASRATDEEEYLHKELRRDAIITGDAEVRRSYNGLLLVERSLHPCHDQPHDLRKCYLERQI